MRRSGSFLPFLLRTSYQQKEDGATTTPQLLPITLLCGCSWPSADRRGGGGIRVRRREKTLMDC